MILTARRQRPSRSQSMHRSVMIDSLSRAASRLVAPPKRLVQEYLAVLSSRTMLETCATSTASVVVVTQSTAPAFLNCGVHFSLVDQRRRRPDSLALSSLDGLSDESSDPGARTKRQLPWTFTKVDCSQTFHPCAFLLRNVAVLRELQALT